MGTGQALAIPGSDGFRPSTAEWRANAAILVAGLPFFKGFSESEPRFVMVILDLISLASSFILYYHRGPYAEQPAINGMWDEMVKKFLWIFMMCFWKYTKAKAAKVSRFAVAGAISGSGSVIGLAPAPTAPTALSRKQRGESSSSVIMPQSQIFSFLAAEIHCIPVAYCRWV